MAGHGDNKKMIIVSRGRRSHGGWNFLAPGSPPPWCSLSLRPLLAFSARVGQLHAGFLHLLSRRSTQHVGIFCILYGDLQRSYSENPKVQSLIKLKQSFKSFRVPSIPHEAYVLILRLHVQNMLKQPWIAIELKILKHPTNNFHSINFHFAQHSWS